VSDPDLGRSSRVMALGTVASRLTGFLRSTATAAALGVAALGNAYATAYTLPLIVYELLLGGVLTSTLVPILVRAQKEDPDGGLRFERSLASTMAATLLLLVILGEVFAPQIVRLYGISDPGQVDITVQLTRLMLPAIFGYGLTAVFGAILNTRGVFGPQMWAPVLNNLVIIVSLVGFGVLTAGEPPTPDTISDPELLVLGLGPVLGILAQTVGLFIVLRRKTEFRWKFLPDPAHARIGQIAGMASWMVVYVVATQIGNATLISILNRAGSEGEPGYAAWTLSQTVWQLPYAIIGVTLITAMLPRMSRAASDGRLTDLSSDLSGIIRLTSTALAVFVAWFVALGRDITVLLFGYGNTSVEQARDIGQVLGLTALGLVPFAINQFQIRAFYALQQSRPPALVNVASQGLRSFLNLASGLLVAGLVIYGTATALVIAYLFAAVLSGVLLRRRIGSQDVRRIMWVIARLVLAAGAAVLAGLLVTAGTTELPGGAHLQSLITLAIGVPLSGLVFVVVCELLRVAELREVLELALGRLLPARLRPRQGS